LKLSEALAMTLTVWGAASGVNATLDGVIASVKEPEMPFSVVELLLAELPLELPPHPAMTNTEQKNNDRKPRFQEDLT
jgi:hypothetical protein